MSKITPNFSDDALVHAALKGDEEAFIQLYRHYLAPLYRFVYTKVNDTEDAEDLTSETFLQALKDLPKFSFRSSFKNWLFGIAKNLLKGYYRQKYQKPLELDENIATDFQKEKEYDTSDQIPADQKMESELQGILQRLPQHYRDVLSLRFLKGYSVAETALALGVSEENAKVLQHRALKKAKSFLKNI